MESEQADTFSPFLHLPSELVGIILRQSPAVVILLTSLSCKQLARFVSEHKPLESYKASINSISNVTSDRLKYIAHTIYSNALQVCVIS